MHMKERERESVIELNLKVQKTIQCSRSMNNYDNQLLTQKIKLKSDPQYNIQEHDYLNIIHTEIVTNTL